MTTTDLATVVPINNEAVLRSLKLNPQDPATQAMLLVCDRFGLDPILKHIVLIEGRPYVTRDGYLHVAHRSGQLDGLEVIDCGDTDQEWWAVVAVYRKDMSRPFQYRGRYPKKGGNSKYGPEMAIKVAEVMALRRAFDVAGLGSADEKHVDESTWVDLEPVLPDGWESWDDCDGTHQEAAARAAALDPEVRASLRSYKNEHGWPMSVTALSGFLDLLDEAEAIEDAEPVEGPEPDDAA